MTVHGVYVPLSPDDVSPVIWRALLSGRYEAKEVRAVRRIVRRGDRVLELGAGIGIVSAVIAKITETVVLAYEANPFTAELAKRVISANALPNLDLRNDLLTVGASKRHAFYVRRDLWMSSLDPDQGPYESVIELESYDVDQVIAKNAINVLVMDIEGAELDLLHHAKLPTIDRILLELHDHLYGMDGILRLTQSLASKGFAYDPRGSRGSCVLFTKDTTPRSYEPEGDEW